MLVYISDEQPWRGERINGMSYPLNIEYLWSTESLAGIGLKFYEPPEEVILPPSREVLAAGVVMERERRMALGFDYNFGDARGIHTIGTTAQDMKGWDEVTKATQAFVALGAPSTEITIVTNTGPATITALEWQMILVAAAQFRQPLWAASFVLQSMPTIPEDYTNDIYWTP